jgi:hypothetical protein
MPIKPGKIILAIFSFVSPVLFSACNNAPDFPHLNNSRLANKYFKEDAQWYLDNIPFFECSDKQIQQVYYYRWKLYKAHLRNVGAGRYVTTEFINHVAWDRDPYCTINAASMHHIYEGRWLRDNSYMDGYINNLYNDSGNNRRYSESIADAAYARYLVNGDAAFLMSHLAGMQQVYDAWVDHYDSSKNLYYIPAMPDATEYTIASIDASGGKDGFEGGDAFRPTINSYMYGNARAIAQVAAMKGDAATNKLYLQRAAALKANVEQNLWNDSLQHFTDRFKVNNQYVHYWDFIRGRELAGLIPWYFDLPADSQVYNAAWKHVLDTTQLLGKYGLRTNEPSYEYYFKQFIFFQGQRGSQWNGPSWPYQTSQVLTAMANLLNDYRQHRVTQADYIKLLHMYTRQHYLPNGSVNLVENYDPNLGGPIVYYYWSNHYNHSSFNNLVITGLCGIRPSEGDTLTIHPLADSTIEYFYLDDIMYHGHKLSVIFDRDGSVYKMGRGLTVLVDSKKANLWQADGKYKAVVAKVILNKPVKQPVNTALNIVQKAYPVPSASVNTSDTSLFQAIDGRIWYFPEITNRWSTLGSTTTTDWYGVDFGKAVNLSAIKLYLFADGKDYFPPTTVSVEYQNAGKWLPLKIKEQKPAQPVGNTVNTLLFDKINATAIRVNFVHQKGQVAVSEIECY